MRILLGLGLAAAIGGNVRGAAAQTAADSSAIVATAHDYIDGWYTGDADRMARALHPELVKRIHTKEPTTTRYQVDQMGASRLVLGTAMGGGKGTPAADRRNEVRILDVFRNTAVARVDAATWIDYLQLVREGDRWLILNVLWELRER